VLVPVAVLCAASGLAVAAALGGLNQMPDDPPPSTTPGEQVDQDLFKTTIVDVVAHKIHDPYTEKTVLDLNLKVYNNATTSVPTYYLEQSILKIAPPAGPPLVAPRPTATASSSPAPSASAPTWDRDTFIPASGVNSRELPPGLTSNVVMRFDVPKGLAVPERLTIDMGIYELHEDWFTKRHRPELVTDDNLVDIVTAKVTLPVKREDT
jgi:hypothetical protein